MSLFYTNKLNECSNLFQDMELLKSKSNTNFNFYNLDLTKTINIDNKYGIIYTSNISEYIDDEKELTIYRDNLNSILNENGIIISSYLIRKFNWVYEKRIMEEKFTYKPIKNGLTNEGYCYIKK